MPLDKRRKDGFGDLECKHGLASARFALDEERTFEGDRGVDRHFQVVGRHIGAGPFETHCHPQFV